MPIYDRTATDVRVEIGKLHDRTAADARAEIGKVYDRTAADARALVWEADIGAFNPSQLGGWEGYNIYSITASALQVASSGIQSESNLFLSGALNWSLYSLMKITFGTSQAGTNIVSKTSAKKQYVFDIIQNTVVSFGAMSATTGSYNIAAITGTGYLSFSRYDSQNLGAGSVATITSIILS